jgi:hypothetical protein
MQRFHKDGRLIIPLVREKETKVNIDKVRFVVNEAYCPNGCNLIDRNYKINDFPGLRIKYRRPGVEGEFIISAIEGDFNKIILSGELKDKVKDELYCPYCDIPLAKLLNCGCQPDADMVVIGLTKKLDFNNAITFCNVTGCEKGSFVQAGHVLRHIRLSHSP